MPPGLQNLDRFLGGYIEYYRAMPKAQRDYERVLRNLEIAAIDAVNLSVLPNSAGFNET